MYKFGKKSEERLATCHNDLRLICNELINLMDVSVLSGHRGEDEQNSLFYKKVSKVQYPNSKHNASPSKAVDIAPYPYPKSGAKSVRLFDIMYGRIDVIVEILLAQGKISHRIRWGGDWDGDGDITDQTFDDLAHIELIS